MRPLVAVVAMDQRNARVSSSLRASAEMGPTANSPTRPAAWVVVVAMVATDQRNARASSSLRASAVMGPTVNFPTRPGVGVALEIRASNRSLMQNSDPTTATTIRRSDPTTTVQGTIRGSDPTTATTTVAVAQRRVRVDSSPKAGAQRATIARFPTILGAVEGVVLEGGTTTTIRDPNRTTITALVDPDDSRYHTIFYMPLGLDFNCGMIASELLPYQKYIPRALLLSFLKLAT